MLEGLVSLASYGVYSGGEIGEFIDMMNQAGFFRYALPFLMIFALVFGILSKTKIFDENRGVNVIIAMVMGLIAVQSSYVSEFFTEISYRLGIGLIIILGILVVVGMFLPDENWATYTLFGISAVVLAVILINTADELNWAGARWWVNNWDWIVGIIVFMLLLIIVSNSSKDKKKSDKPSTVLRKALFDD